MSVGKEVGNSCSVKILHDACGAGSSPEPPFLHPYQVEI